MGVFRARSAGYPRRHGAGRYELEGSWRPIAGFLAPNSRDLDVVGFGLVEFGGENELK